LPDGQLEAVAALSATNAWAVGVVILHWNGRAWKRVPSPNSGVLGDVAATSARNAWAIGQIKFKTLILHWNGIAWKTVTARSS
jgi:hypothetical protein